MRHVLCLSLALLVATFTACGGQDDEIQVPGTSTMNLESDLVKQMYNGGTGSTSYGLTQGDGSGGSWFKYNHVTNAIVRGGVAGVAIGVIVAPSIAGWGTCIANGFQYDAVDKVWRSSGVISFYGKTYTVEGEVAVDLLANTNSYKLLLDGKLLATGTSDTLITSGTWKLYDTTQATPVHAVTFDWAIGSGSRSVKGSVVLKSSKYVGTTAALAAAGSLRTLEVDVPGEGNFELAIDVSTKEGSIKASNYNGGAKGCWDSSFKDAACK